MTENGWPACGPDLLERNPVPGTGIVIPLQRGIPNTIMKAFAADFHAYVESLNNARAGTDEGGWTGTNSVPTSNHLGGTAMDLNWSDHPMGNAYAGFSQAEIAACREVLAFYEKTIFWGNDWNSPKDSMHFQMGYDTYNSIAKCNDFIRRKIRADGFSTFRRGGSGGGTVPDVVVQPAIWAELGVSGDHVKRLQSFLNDRYKMGLDVDGDYGPLTRDAVRAFQSSVGVDNDGIVGPITLAKLKANGFNADGGNVIVAPPKPWPASASDRELLEYVAAQAGPGDPSWSSKGMTQRDKVYAIATKLGV